jgi:hypothetical protein
MLRPAFLESGQSIHSASSNYAPRGYCVRFEAFTAVTMENGVSGMLRRVAVVRTDVSEELSASFMRVTRIGELGKTQVVISSQRASVASYS